MMLNVMVGPCCLLSGLASNQALNQRTTLKPPTACLGTTLDHEGKEQGSHFKFRYTSYGRPGRKSCLYIYINTISHSKQLKLKFKAGLGKLDWVPVSPERVSNMKVLSYQTPNCSNF